jgi:hypothetical protein
MENKYFSLRITKKAWKLIAIISWILFVALFGIGYYVNHYMPHGQFYSTGDYVCQNDDRGPCHEEYKEDLRFLNIPKWAKFIRTSEGEVLIFGLLFVAIVSSSLAGKNEE